MEYIVVRNYEEMSRMAAEQIAQIVQENPRAVLGLATGSTPVGIYRALVEMYKLGKVDFSRVKTFNLDEYVGLPNDHPQSYHVYMQDHLFTHVNAVPEHIHIPNGFVQNFEKECVLYDDAIEDAGGIDLQILGIGANGHIGFNEPGSSPFAKTSVVQLAESTIQANSRFFNGFEEVPKEAITVGIGTILMNSKHIILLASGEGKAHAIKKMIDQEPNLENPASFLKQHPHVTVILDEEAAKYLDTRYEISSI
jgi:glucosamine-6-phosphate deaminase